jgi:Glucose / Sorbosone dehydrogenase
MTRGSPDDQPAVPALDRGSGRRTQPVRLRRRKLRWGRRHVVATATHRDGRDQTGIRGPFIHNGGGIAFGPDDGFLCLGIGDGGGGNDQHGAIGNAQSLTTLLGKMLRIDIAAGAGGFNYRIPPGNPFAANPPCGANGSGTMNCPEIFAWRFRRVCFFSHIPS